jgi:hypothetical protein
MKTELPSQFDVHPEKFEYEYFTQASIQKDIYAFAENTVEFLEGLGECNVLFFDRSARTAYIVLDEYWNLKHDNDDLPKPKFYFINPRGFKDRPRVDVIQEIDKSLSGLDKEKPLVLVDVCIHTGDTMETVGNYLYTAGFKNIKVVIANTRTNHSDINSEIPSVKLNTCHTFGDPSSWGNIIKQQSDSIISQKRIKNLKNPSDKIEQHEANMVRKELRQIVRERFEKK